MIHSKNNGFTLIEVLLALAIMGLVLTPIFILQSTVMQRVARASARVVRMWYAKLFLVESRIAIDQDKKQATLEQKKGRPSAILKYERKAVPEKSVFKKINNMQREQVKISWNDGNRPRTDALVGFVFSPPKEEKKS